MVLRWIFRIVQRVRNNFLDGIIHRWIHAVQLAVQFLYTISVICDIVFAHSNIFQRHGILERFTFHAMT